jgi:hypothetical protein
LDGNKMILTNFLLLMLFSIIFALYRSMKEDK